MVLQQVQHTLSLSASVGHGDAFVAVGIPPNLTHCSKAVVRLVSSVDSIDFTASVLK